MLTRTRSFFIATGLALLTACGDGTAPSNTPDQAALAAKTFSDLADSVGRSGGDADLGGAYSAIAGTVRMGGRISPIVITIDGVATTFNATATATEVEDSDPQQGPTKFRSFIAWDKDNPRRVVQLSSSSDSDPIAAMLYPTLLASYAPMASLIYMDGNGGTYFGTSGSQAISYTPTTTACPAPADSGKGGRVVAPRNCTQADFRITFDGKAEPSPFLVEKNTATGTRSITMSIQTVAGVHHKVTLPRCDSSCIKPAEPISPPVVVRPSNELPSLLSVKVDTAVTLTLTIKNPQPEPLSMKFPGGQRYDFVVTDSSTGRDVWRWAEGRAFTKEIGEHTIPGGGSLVFTETWKPAKRGVYLARGALVSITHRSESYARVIVP